MDLFEQMATFVRIVEARSLSAAARQLRLSLPAVSRQLAALERDLGTPLVLRTTRRLTVTEVGRQYYERCVRILRDVEEAQASARGHDRVEGRLVVTASVTFGLLQLLPLLPGLRAAHPRLHVDLRLEDRFVDVVGDGVDVAIRAGPTLLPDTSGFIAAPLQEFRRVAVAASAYLRRRGEPREPAALARHDAIVQLSGSGARLSTWRMLRDDREEQVEVSGPLACTAMVMLRDAALAGLGVAMIPAWMAEEGLAAGTLRVVPHGWEGPPGTVSAMYRTELRGSPRVRAFVEHLRAGLQPATRPRRRAG